MHTFCLLQQMGINAVCLSAPPRALATQPRQRRKRLADGRPSLASAFARVALPHCPTAPAFAREQWASAASACPLPRLCKRVNSLRLGPDPWPPLGRRATLSLSTCRLQGLKQQKARTFSLAQIPKEPKAVTPYYKE